MAQPERPGHQKLSDKDPALVAEEFPRRVHNILKTEKKNSRAL